MKLTKIIIGALVGLQAFSASANLMTTGNIIKNPEFSAAAGEDLSTGAREDWIVQEGSFNFALISEHPASAADTQALYDSLDPSIEYRAAFGGAVANAYLYQTHTIEEHRLNAGLIDSGLVTVDMSMYIGSSYSDRDRSRMYITFSDENGVNIESPTVMGYYDLSSWSYREMTDIVVPVGTRNFKITLHNDRLDGTGNSTGIALPDVRFALEDNAMSAQALAEFGYLQLNNVPVPFVGALALLGLAVRRRIS